MEVAGGDPGAETDGIDAVRRGAQDYLLKNAIDAKSLMKSLRTAIERSAQESNFRSYGTQAQLALNAMGQAVLMTDSRERITYLNPSAELLTGWLSKDAIGRASDEVMRMMDIMTGLPVCNPVTRMLNPDYPQKATPDCVLIRKNGSELTIEENTAPIRDSLGAITGIVMVFNDVSYERIRYSRLAHLAEHDGLTDLCNRTVLRDRTTQAIALARRNRHAVAIMYLDLDGFKQVNDSFGHATGDQLLVSVSRRLRDCTRRSDTVSREGGDEFVVLLADLSDPSNAAHSAEKIRNSVARTHRVGERDINITVSIGIASWPENGDDADSLIRAADRAMYEAKAHGRNNHQFADRVAPQPILRLRLVRP